MPGILRVAIRGAQTATGFVVLAAFYIAITAFLFLIYFAIATIRNRTTEEDINKAELETIWEQANERHYDYSSQEFCRGKNEEQENKSFCGLTLRAARLDVVSVVAKKEEQS